MVVFYSSLRTETLFFLTYMRNDSNICFVPLITIFIYRSDGQVVSVTDCSVKRRMFEPHMNAGFQCGAWSLHRPAFYDAITGPTEFISTVNSVKIVNIPYISA